MKSLLEVLELSFLPVPDYSRLSRRGKALKVKLFVRKQSRKLDLVVDSTGLKIYGEGEWKMKVHGKQKRRTWRKLHIAVDPHSFQTVSMELTLATQTDGMVFPLLLKPFKQVNRVYGDGAYTYQNCFEAMAALTAQPRIPLRTGTSLSPPSTPGLAMRNRLIQEIWNYGGKVAWKKESDYHRRSLVETQMYRFKTTFGEKLASRNFQNQGTEARLKMSLLNRMSQLGMPESIAVKVA